jgi:ribosomal protein S18 acetylase RimI-like enzyme
MTISIRPALTTDVPALVRLRQANGRRHAELDPHYYRVPDAEAARRYFEEELAEPGSLILVAEVSGEVAGMVQVVFSPTPPDHQSLLPMRTAEIHTVVLDAYRGKGIGQALVAAAEREAVGQGVEILIAPIADPNTGATRFYSRSGYGPHGILLSKPLPQPPGAAV